MTSTELHQLEHIIQYEANINPFYIVRPLSIYHVFIKQYNKFNKKKYKRKGLSLCHGHNYNNNNISKLKFIKNWYYVDINKSAYPDYVADVTNSYQMNYFPDNYFDCILSNYCPVVRYISENPQPLYHLVLKNMYRIIKKNGVICLNEFPKLFFWFISDIEFNEIVKKIHEIVPEKNLELFKEKLIKDNAFSPEDLLEDFYKEIIINYHDDKKLTKLIDELSLYYTKRFLKDNNFEFIGIKSSILFAKPIY